MIGYLYDLHIQLSSLAVALAPEAVLPARPATGQWDQNPYNAPSQNILPLFNSCAFLGSTMSELKQKFDASVQYVQNANGNFKPSNDVKLEFYALFKQATEGDVKGKKPGLTDFIGRAKYGAWETLKGMSSEKAMETYIAKIEALKAKHG